MGPRFRWDYSFMREKTRRNHIAPLSSSRGAACNCPLHSPAARWQCGRFMTSKPQLLVWITCDGVHVDPATGKHTLLGVFSSIRARQFPVVHPGMFWFLVLTDVATGPHKLRVSLGLDPTKQVPFIERDFESPGPVHRINLINEIRNLTFAIPGDYSIIVEVDEEPILATALPVTL